MGQLDGNVQGFESHNKQHETKNKLLNKHETVLALPVEGGQQPQNNAKGKIELQDSGSILSESREEKLEGDVFKNLASGTTEALSHDSPTRTSEMSAQNATESNIVSTSTFSSTNLAYAPLFPSSEYNLSDERQHHYIHSGILNESLLDFSSPLHDGALFPALGVDNGNGTPTQLWVLSYTSDCGASFL